MNEKQWFSNNIESLNVELSQSDHLRNIKLLAESEVSTTEIR